MRIFCYAILFIEVSASCVNSNIMGTTHKSIFIKSFNKLRIGRCSPRFIKPISKRIAPVWSLKDLYETEYRPPAEENGDASVIHLTTYKPPVSRKEIVLYIPYTRRSTTESTIASTTETTTEETTTKTTTTHATIKTSKATEMKSHFFFLTTTRAPYNHQQNKSTSRKIHKSPDKKIQPKKTLLKITKSNKNKTRDDKEINFNFLSGFEPEYDDVDHTNNKILKAIEQLNIQGRVMFPETTNKEVKRKPLRDNKPRNILTTQSTTTNATNVKAMFSKIINKHLKKFHKEDSSVIKKYNTHDVATRTTSSWKKSKPVKRNPTTPEAEAYQKNTRQINSREYYRSGHVVDRLKHVLLNYDISQRPEQRGNSLQKFSVVYVPLPLKLKARYNYLNHYPVNPRMQVLLSNYGYYLPGSLGIRRYPYGLYNHMAYNNIYVNKPFGATYSDNSEPDPEPWYP